MNKLSERLTLISEFAETGETLIDIGTDHAYIPVDTVKSGRFQRAIASDLRSGAVKIAENNVKSFGYEDRIKVVQSDGLENVEIEEGAVIVIAGMGGSLISQILEKAGSRLDAAKRLVLQPQSEIDILRKTLKELGYCPVDEKMVFEAGHYYTVIKAEKKEMPGEDNEFTKVYGRILVKKKDPVFFDFLRHELEKSINIKKHLEKTCRGNEKISLLENKINIIKSVLEEK